MRLAVAIPPAGHVSGSEYWCCCRKGIVVCSPTHDQLLGGAKQKRVCFSSAPGPEGPGSSSSSRKWLWKRAKKACGRVWKAA